MPTVISTTPVSAYAHCPDSRCRGNEQQIVDGIREEIGVTFLERGGDLPNYENTYVTFNFAKPEERGCPFCERPREITGERRRRYESTGYGPQDELLKLKVAGDGWL